MSIGRVLFCIICPPLAVIDKGFKSFLITTILTCMGLGFFAAFIINMNE